MAKDYAMEILNEAFVKGINESIANESENSEEEFIKFVNGLMVENANDIESTKEAWNRMIILNALGGFPLSEQPAQHIRLPYLQSAIQVNPNV